MDIKSLAEKCTKQTPEAAFPRPPVSENWSEIFSVRGTAHVSRRCRRATREIFAAYAGKKESVTRENDDAGIDNYY